MFVNKQESDVLNVLLQHNYISQRILSEMSGHSLGVVNRSIKNLISGGYIDEKFQPTNLAYEELKEKSPQNAIILAAGFGMRMVPINLESPKAFIEVNGESLIERIIEQLHEVGIKKIYIVVGFMKEQFEYLIDEYGVELIVNEQYAEKNNLHSLALAREYIANTYIVPCDVWCDLNPFHHQELYSWYMVSDLVDNDSTVRVNRKMELVCEQSGGNQMVGITYLVGNEADEVRKRLDLYDKNKKYNHSFWEETLIEGDKFLTKAKVVHSSEVVEINTYEQLRELDEESNYLKSDAIEVISSSLNVNQKDIINIEVLKKGMTNRSFLFTCNNQKYIMRIPGEGTDQLINRSEEAAVYTTIKEMNICDRIIYVNPKNGYKITEFMENSRCCDSESEDDLKKCISKLREFHKMKLRVNHCFDIFGQIDFYESLWGDTPSIYRDYTMTKSNIYKLKEYIDAQKKELCLTHIDAVPDNFLFTEDGQVKLIDWEYAGMQDPHVDIAMFCIYAMYNKEQIDHLIDIYFEKKCDRATRIKIYCYIAVCGLLWSNWCEYKRNLGVEFGEYSLKQYRYAKEYYKIVREELKNES